MTERHPVWQLLDKLQMDNREQAAKLVELRALVSQLELPNPAKRRCDTCGVSFRNQLLRDEHVYHSHQGPVPEHYLRAERLANLGEEAA